MENKTSTAPYTSLLHMSRSEVNWWRVPGTCRSRASMGNGRRPPTLPLPYTCLSVRRGKNQKKKK